MKIRNGFVSNSSSSSFLVAFPREPKSVEDVKEMLFVKGQNDYVNPWPEYARDDELFWSVDQVAEIVWTDIQEQGNPSEDELFECIDGGWFESYEELPGHVDEYRHDRRDEKFRKMRDEVKHLDWSTEEGREAHQRVYDTISEESARRAKAILERFKKNNKAAVFYTFEYSDNDGALFSAMEHGSLFRRLTHIKVSRH